MECSFESHLISKLAKDICHRKGKRPRTKIEKFELIKERWEKKDKKSNRCFIMDIQSANGNSELRTQ